MGLEPRVHQPQMENKFWKIVGNMKIYKGTSYGNSPGLTNRRHATRFHLWKGSPVKRLSYGKRSTGGRNCHGKITVRHRGGGHKKRVRIIDFHRQTPGELILLRNLSTNEFSYIIRCQDVEIGQIIYTYPAGIPKPIPGQLDLPKSQIVQPGSCLPLYDIPVGTVVHCIALKAGGRAVMCRAAGTSAQIISNTANGYTQLRLSSGEVRMVPGKACATIGVVANETHKLRNWGKAGGRRRKGWRPSVRGIAMSPVDHPHGGGGKSKGGKAARSPWGWLTKGPKTVKRNKWYVITPRWKAKND
ncbi:hypothetical protein HDV02_001852 [Globomyces sp. JEL0801]|nr:hypothetical protein HDV02_001852 [Globomyces sp. JEL0801]